jgi:serine acetyltransferase
MIARLRIPRNKPAMSGRTTDGQALSLIVSDLRRRGARNAVSAMRVLLTEPGSVALVVIRLEQAAYRKPPFVRPLSWLLRHANLIFYGIDVLPQSHIGHSALIPHPQGIVIGSGAVLGNEVTILQGVTLGVKDVRGGVKNADQPWGH